eukprot:TRINITY_DN5658_c0_g1_i2.p1 TRINITY_DN5658_c0_g1~~TRINITY_DN5658_c0_g1_i2.p1  ORF type:complete len:183 (-),score=38.42 TRINITY_DN5658_c0_g1_i2:9-557(-)
MLNDELSIFVINPSVLDHKISLLGDSESFPLFCAMDVQVVENKSASEHIRSFVLEKFASKLQSQLLSRDLLHVVHVEESFEDALPTIAGWLLDYHVVYYFSSILQGARTSQHSSKNSLSGSALVLVKLWFHPARGGCSPLEDSIQFESFSCPAERQEYLDRISSELQDKQIILNDQKIGHSK